MFPASLRAVTSLNICSKIGCIDHLSGVAESPGFAGAVSTDLSNSQDVCRKDFHFALHQWRLGLKSSPTRRWKHGALAEISRLRLGYHQQMSLWHSSLYAGTRNTPPPSHSYKRREFNRKCSFVPKDIVSENVAAVENTLGCSCKLW